MEESSLLPQQPDIDAMSDEEPPAPSSPRNDVKEETVDRLEKQEHPKKQKVEQSRDVQAVQVKVQKMEINDANEMESETTDELKHEYELQKMQNITGAETETSQAQSSSIDPSKFVNKDGKLLMYWFDAYEDPYNAPGTIWLFGKVIVPGVEKTGKPKTVSCCIVVKNMLRNLYLLPRSEEGRKELDKKLMFEMHQEFNTIRQEYGISSFQCKPVKRQYAFEERKDGIPFESNYLKVLYPFKDQRIPRDKTGKTFSRIFGSQTSALELFVLKRRLMGPCWLSIEGATLPKVNRSWCKKEFEVNSQKCIKVLPDKDAPPVPDFSVMSIYFKHVINRKTKEKEIVTISAVIHKSVDISASTKDEKPHVQFSVVRTLKNQAIPFDLKEKIGKAPIKICHSEREMYNFFLAQMHKQDPDVLVGHNMIKYKFEMLLNRFQKHNVSFWSKMGRLRKTKLPTSSRAVEYGAASGRIICDTLVSAMEFLREKTYTLDHLVKTQLKITNRREIDSDEASRMLLSSRDILSLVSNCAYDASLQLQLMFKLQILPLTRQLTELCGNLWNRSLMSRRAERNEFVLLHEFHKLKYIPPEKYTARERKIRAGEDPNKKKSKGRKKKAAYAGGLVLEPKKGFYDKFVLLLDFNSLYPSIIREWNICFSTVKHWEVKTEDELPEVPEKGDDGVLPKVIGHFLVRRKAVKDMLKGERNPDRRESLDIRQKALKLVANSMYGCLGFDSSRFYCKPMAALITALGRDSLTNAKKAAENINFVHPIEVIYGDTDSIMVHTGIDDYQEAKKVASEIKKAVNQGYKHMFLELDACYKCILLLRKKKYAAVPIKEENGVLVAQDRELKGLDIVRRDWCGLSKDISRFVLDELLSSKSRETAVENIHEYLESVKLKIDKSQIPKGKYIITKGLTKSADEYADANQFPHVTVALSQIKEGKIVKAGDHIPYIITKGEGSVSERAVHASKVMKQGKNEELKIDTDWYITHQILPPVARLCDVISETSPGQLAERLGLDPQRFEHATGVSQYSVVDQEENVDMHGLTESGEAERFVDYTLEDAFEFTCPYCLEVKRKYRDIFNTQLDGQYMLLCENSQCKGADSQKGGVLQCPRDVIRMKNSLTLQLRHFIAKYYERVAQCDDPMCRHRTKSNSSQSCDQTGCQGRMVPLYSAKNLYDQLCYYKWIFNIGLARKRVHLENQKREETHKVALRTNPNDKLVLAAPQRIPSHVNDYFEQLHGFVSTMIERSGYHYVDMSSLLSMFA